MKNSKDKHVMYNTQNEKIRNQTKWKIIFKISSETLPQILSTVKIKISTK